MKLLKRMFVMWLVGLLIVGAGIGGIWLYNKYGSKVPEIGSKGSTSQTGSTYSEMVYIDATNSYYHRNGCKELLQNDGFIYKNDAQQRGYKACPKCKP